MKKWLIALLFVASAAQAGQVPSPLNAPSSMPSGHVYLSGSNPQQTVDGGVPLTTGAFASPPAIGNTTPNSMAGTTFAGTGIAQFGTNGSNVFLGTASSGPTSNGLEIIPSVSGQRPTLQFFGVDATRGDQIWSQGTGNLILGDSTNNNNVGSLIISDCGGPCVNALSVSGGISGARALISSASGIGIGSPFLVNPTVTWSGTTSSSGFVVALNNSGTTTSASPIMATFNIADTIDGSGLGSAPVTGVNVQEFYGGGTTKGGRIALNALLTDSNGATADTADNYYVASVMASFRSHTQGGVSPTSAGAKGRIFGGNSVASISSGATNLYELSSHEFDCDASGGSIFLRFCVVAASLSSANVQGAGADAAYIAYLGNAQQSPFKNGLLFGSPVNAFPLDATVGTGVGMYPGVSGANNALWGIDFDSGNFPATGNAYDGGFLRSKGFSVDGAGTTRIGSCYFTWSSTGIAADCKGSVGNIASGAGAISAAGSGFPQNIHTAAWDQYGGVYDLTVAGGVATSVTVETQPIFPAQTGLPTTIALTTSAGNPGTGVVLTASWNSTANSFSVNPSGVVKVGIPTVVASLPTCNTASKGGRASVTDATIPTFLGTLTGGGAVVTPVFCNGTAWVAG